jgi:tRNA threonylcarbamoyl adenosine modification protein YjeE
VAPLEIPLPTPDATRALGRALAACASEPGTVLALEGPLGAGKTSLAKSFIAARAGVAEEDVTSPTFTLANEYPATPPILHLDAYRLTSGRDLDDLGFGAFEASGRIVIIEWAARVRDALPADRIEIEMEHRPPGRLARVTATGTRSAQLLARLTP